MLANNPCLLLSFVLHRTLWLKRVWLLFQSRVRHFCKTLQSYNSPAPRARELFKPSTDLASLLVEMEKNFFAVWDTCGWRHKWLSLQSHCKGCFCVYLVTFTQAWAPIHWAMFWFKLFLETRPKSASLEHLNVFLAYLEPKLWIKKQKVVHISVPTNPNLGWTTPLC